MKRSRVLLVGFICTLACATAPGTEIEPAGPRGDSKTITAADVGSATQLNLLDYVVAERPHWLRTPDGRPAQVAVFLDDARLGGASTLKSITLRDVTLVRYYEASAAQQKFNGRDIGPVIHVITR
jgi:hypothetical protein